MEVEDGAQLDDKAKRMRDLLSSFYSPDPSSASSPPQNTSSRFATLDAINTTSFDADQYMNLLVQKSNLEGLLQRHVEMAAEIKNLDTDLQMLVYENYNKFISATDTIKRMKNNIGGMETNMDQLLEKIMSVQSRSDGVNTSLLQKREHIEKLHRTRNLLRKVQVLDLYIKPLTRLLCFSCYEEASCGSRQNKWRMDITKKDTLFSITSSSSLLHLTTFMTKLWEKLFINEELLQFMLLLDTYI
ncbi:hypothetical protein CDL12_30426 [Handroanthus impetiginosus]|uniref:Vacuolar protein sorting-associated protein 51 homolog n=1 Tax=Handroanthus impetiginosus TaxID=429701 RepID=A0A2G9FVJ7_9LAMI|nr:hypothetical protein CDL12_30426 [Handroanthus impetiginosus]